MSEYGESRAFSDWVDVVVLCDENGRTVPVTGTVSVDLADEEIPQHELLSELLDSTVRLTTAEGVLSVVLDTLRAIPVPAAFAASPWLTDSRPIVVRDGVGCVGGLSVRYSDTVGLRITGPDADLDYDDQNG
ncbi:hypothetical protein [Micromonospora sp. NPDC051296]|uniref:hypothetical protein n=1 Tax=Micromonospora sp. NPDC051296 TaxID=3155046 RepID=UPI00341B5F63